MTSKNKVDVTIKGNKNVGAFAGGSIGRSSSEDTENEVRAIIEGDDNQPIIAGSDIGKISQINGAMSELAHLLMDGLKDKSDKEYVQEIIDQLKEQVAKPEPERNKSKIKGVLNNLASYIGLAGFAAEKVKALYELVLNFFK